MKDAASPRDRVTGFFVARGYEPLNHDKRHESALLFAKGQERIAVKVCAIEDLRERNSLLQSLLQATNYQWSANAAYIALPTAYAALVDAKVLQAEGLGLVIHDDRRIEEVVQPQRKQARLCDQPEAAPQDQNLESVTSLRAKIVDLEQTVRLLNAELQRVKQNQSPRPTRIPTKICKPLDTSSQPNSIPDFLQGNPWLDILSRRGEENEEPFN